MLIKLNSFAILVTLCIALIGGIIWAIVDTEKSRVQIGMGHSKGYTLLMDAKWWIGLFLEMAGAFIWGIIGAMFNLAIMLIKFVFNGFPENKIPQPQAYDKSIPEDKGF